MVDTIITLFESTETEFTSNGLGALPDALSCVVTEERNGAFELELVYPITGKRYNELSMRRIILAKSNPFSFPQPFRIYAISKPINGIVTINAEHISYDLSGYAVSPFIANSVSEAFVNMKGASVISCPFTFSTDKSTSAQLIVLKPCSMRSLLGGSEGTILDLYHGEYEFDGYSVKLWNNRGADRGVTIRYGKNLIDLTQEENCSMVYTGVYPFWYSEQDGLVQLSEKIINAEGTYNFTRIYPLDLSQEWQEKPTQAQIRTAAKDYMKDNKIGVPQISLTVSFVQLAQSEEYREYALLETVHLCDTVRVEFPELNVSATAKCIRTTYDVLTGKYESIELGDAKSNLATTITNQTQAINQAPNKTFMEQAIETATKLITGGLGGFVVLHSSSGGEQPDEILIMDTDDIHTATKVWRWNKGGLGYSQKGYNGPFETAVTQNGQIVADFITAGTMSANRINGGTLILGGKNNSDGVCLIKNDAGDTLIRLDKNGITLSNSVKISYGNLSNTPNITQITKDTITTSYINALDITAKQVNCVSGDNEANINGGFSHYRYKGNDIGHVGTNRWSGTENYGLTFDLDMPGNYMAWCRKVNTGSEYISCLYYSRDDDMLHVGANINMEGFELKNVSFEGSGVSAEMHFVQVKEVGSGGTVTKCYRNGMLKFINGILVDASFG